MKLVKIKKTGKKSLYTTFLYMTLLPLLAFGLFMCVLSCQMQKTSIEEETCQDLKNVAGSVLIAYDMACPGSFSYSLDGNFLSFYKGDYKLNDQFILIDRIKERTGIDISLFLLDRRMLTTLMKDGERALNTGASKVVMEQVPGRGQAQFFTNSEIFGTIYYTYYEPIFDEAGLCIGMIGVAKSATSVQTQIQAGLIKNIIFMLLAMLVTGFLIVRYTSRLMKVIKDIMEFLQRLSKADLSAKLDDTVAAREDELGEMGRSTVKVQISLRRFIERDALTGLYNRRFGEKKLKEIMNSCACFSIAIGDIDFFKKFNDQYGHECGDIVLKEVAEVLNEGMTGMGIAARWGGEEFLLIFENINAQEANDKLEEILDRIRGCEVNYEEQVHHVRMTFGIVDNTEKQLGDELLRAADEKLYQGKKEGRDRVVV